MDFPSRSVTSFFTARASLPAAVSLAVLLASTPMLGHTTMLEVSIDSSVYKGISGLLAFDFIDGDGLTNNSVTVSDFFTDGTLGVATPTGSASGSLVSPNSLTLADADWYTSVSQAIDFGTSITFKLDLTEQGSAGTPPDSFAVFLLDASGDSLFSTTDFLTGADALFAVDIDGTPTGHLQVFAADTTNPSPTWSVQTLNTVPIPGTAWLLGSALLGGLAARRLRREGSSSNYRNIALDS